MKPTVIAFVLVLLACSLAHAQNCTEDATIGQFDVSFEGASFDGADTEFEYCITGLGDPALSHWELTLDPACIEPGNLTGCGPVPCYYQEDDPTTGVTGIKWDDLEVEPGETECFTFSLAGDWTGQIGDVLIGLKAGLGVHYGDVCGPICVGCALSLRTYLSPEGRPGYSVNLTHNLPPTVETHIEYTLFNARDRKVRWWRTEDFLIEPGDSIEDSGLVPVGRPLRAGPYRLEMKMRGMGRWIVRSTTFVVSR